MDARALPLFDLELFLKQAVAWAKLRSILASSLGVILRRLGSGEEESSRCHLFELGIISQLVVRSYRLC